MKKTSKKAYVGIVCICALVAALVFGGKAILIRYAAKNSSLDGLQAAEKFDGRYYDKENNLYLTFSENGEAFLMTDGSAVYRVSFRRGGFSGDLFVMFSDESGENGAFTGSAKIDKDGAVIKIECDSKKYNKLNFTKEKAALCDEVQPFYLSFFLNIYCNGGHVVTLFTELALTCRVNNKFCQLTGRMFCIPKFHFLLNPTVAVTEYTVGNH